MTALKRSKPDGYTIALGSGSHFAIAPHARNMGFDPKTDFIPVFQVNGSSFMLVTKSTTPWKTYKDLIEDAKKRPGKISISSNGAWGSSHLGIIQIMRAANVKFKHVPFRGGGKAWQAMYGGHTDLGWANVTTGGTLGRVKSGDLTLIVERPGHCVRQLVTEHGEQSLWAERNDARFLGQVRIDSPTAAPAGRDDQIHRFIGRGGRQPSLDLLLGQCYEHMGQSDRALEAYRRALSADARIGMAREGVKRTTAALGQSKNTTQPTIPIALKYKISNHFMLKLFFLLR